MVEYFLFGMVSLVVLFFLYKYHLFYLANSNFIFDSTSKKLCFHFYRYFNGLFFFISVFLHCIAFFLLSSVFSYCFFYFWVFKSFWLAFILFYFAFVCLLLPLILLSFFIILDLFYYNMFFHSYFNKSTIFYLILKKIHFWNFFLFPFLFLASAGLTLFNLYKYYFLINTFKFKFVFYFVILLFFLIKNLLGFFDQINVIFCGESLFAKKNTVYKKSSFI